MSVPGDDDEILDPHSQLAGNVDPRLDRHHLAGLEHVLGAVRDARRLVDLEADTVAEPVAEALAVAGLLDDLAGDGVDRLTALAGRDRLEGRRLGSRTVS